MSDETKTEHPAKASAKPEGKPAAKPVANASPKPKAEPKRKTEPQDNKTKTGKLTFPLTGNAMIGGKLKKTGSDVELTQDEHAELLAAGCVDQKWPTENAEENAS